MNKANLFTLLCLTSSKPSKSVKENKSSCTGCLTIASNVTRESGGHLASELSYSTWMTDATEYSSTLSASRVEGF